MRVEELDYDLPTELIAQEPAPQRSSSRLLIANRGTGELRELRFAQLGQALRPDDVLVVNNTRVIPARFFLRRSTGGLIDGLWLGTNESGDWRVLLRGAGRVRVGEQLEFLNKPEQRSVTLLARGPRGEHMLRVWPAADALAVLHEVGIPPLPPYISRRTGAAEPRDYERYQTIYARRAGAVAAPTAGLHFDAALLDELRQRGIRVVEITLDVGSGTFQPIEVEDLQDHVMHSERYEVAAEIWQDICSAREAGRRIVAVGTTSARVLETLAGGGELHGSTNIFLYPPCTFHMTDALITNFHLPRSTLLAMIYAFGGIERMRQAYRHAIAARFRFYSYGDAMFIES